MNDDDLIRYSRHILLPEIEYEGQEKICNSHALVMGAGGLGSSASIYLAASGIGKLTICDFDQVELSNLQRQILHSDEVIGLNKASSAEKTLKKMNPQIQVNKIEKKLSIDEAKKAVVDVDVILDCSDNFETRYALNKIAFDKKIPLVSGAAIKFDGQLCVFNFKHNETPCYHCLFPDSSSNEELRCSDHGVISPLVGIIGSMQALEALKILIDMESDIGKLLVFDAKNLEWNSIKFKKDPSCSVCSKAK